MLIYIFYNQNTFVEVKVSIALNVNSQTQEKMSDITHSVLYNWAKEVWNEKNRDAIDKYLDEDILIHGLGADLPGSEFFKIYFDTFQKEYTNTHMEVLEVLTSGELEAALTTFSATHAASGIDIIVSGQVMIKMTNGKITEAWNHYDFLSMYDQLGYKLEKKS